MYPERSQKMRQNVNIGNPNIMPLKTLFLNPPSFENFDGGAGSRWPATREIESYWYPVWLAYPAGMLEGARLLDAPSHHVSAEETIKIARGLRISGAVHQHSGFPRRYPAGEQDQRSQSPDQDRFCRPSRNGVAGTVAAGLPVHRFRGAARNLITPSANLLKASRLEEILGISFLKNGSVVHTPDRPEIQDLDSLPHVTEIYRRDLDVTPVQRAIPAVPVSFRSTPRAGAPPSAPSACGRRL